MPVTSSIRTLASAKLRTYDTTIVGVTGKNEIDNHADTICAGPNWKLLELSGEFYSVTPFSTDYQPKVNIPVGRCATTYTCPETGQSILLVADQVLWFGNDLHCSLINPNQIRSFGHSVCDDPWDQHRSIGMDVDSFFIPFYTAGPTLYFETSVPLIGNLRIYNSSNLPLHIGIPIRWSCLFHALNLTPLESPGSIPCLNPPPSWRRSPLLLTLVRSLVSMLLPLPSMTRLRGPVMRHRLMMCRYPRQ